MKRILTTLLLAATLTPAQSKLSFEVASVKSAVRDEDAGTLMLGGPGTADPERIHYERVSFSRLLHAAYGMDYDQIAGPSWIGTELYTVVANVPAGATKEDAKLMWQNLLAERFSLQVHFAKKDFPTYELTQAKTGAKLSKGGEGKSQPGFPEPRAGQTYALAVPQPRVMRLTFRNAPIDELMRRISWPLSTPVRSNELVLGRVIDKTGLSGLFDFTLEFAGGMGPGGASPSDPPDGAPMLIDALRQQLGLILVEKKAPLDVLVVDHAYKVPAEN